MTFAIWQTIIYLGLANKQAMVVAKMETIAWKKWIFIVVVASLVLLAGCFGESPPSPEAEPQRPPEPTGIQVYSDPDQTIEVNVGERFIIALKSNPTTGYSWQVQFDASFLELIQRKYEPSLEGGEGTELMGRGGTESFEFQTLKEGQTKVRMIYKRPWEEAFIEDKVFKISIK